MPDIMIPRDATPAVLNFIGKQTGRRPECAICGKPVDAGGRVDHLFPYYSERNRCGACLEGGKAHA